MRAVFSLRCLPTSAVRAHCAAPSVGEQHQTSISARCRGRQLYFSISSWAKLLISALCNYYCTLINFETRCADSANRGRPADEKPSLKFWARDYAEMRRSRRNGFVALFILLCCCGALFYRTPLQTEGSPRWARSLSLVHCYWVLAKRRALKIWNAITV